MRVKLDIPLKVEEICAATEAKPGKTVELDYDVNAICTDTRECEIGDLFIAVNGESDSGEKHIKDALLKKCHIIACSKDDHILRVNDSADALSKIATLYKSKTKVRYTVAVTGSVGKSTTVKFISRILKKKFKVHSPNGNFNNHLGVPLTVLGASKDCEVMVTELGMNHKNEISRLSKCVQPDIGIITSIGTSHIGNLGSREDIAKAKLEILDGMNNGTLLLPYDEPLLRGLSNSLSVARNSSLSDFSLHNDKNGFYSLSSPYGNICGLSFFDSREHLLCDLAFSISAAQLIGMSKAEIIKGVKAITESDLRQRLIVLKDFSIFDDSYNASLESVTADLKYISSLSCPCGAFLGDILELGEKAESIHEKIGGIAAQLKIDHLYLYGSYAESTARGAIQAGMDRARIFVNTDIVSPEISVKHLMDNHTCGELILFKASHKLRLDKIADMIAEEERNDNER